MIKINSKAECCGCGACEAICPTKSTVLCMDNEGFIYPHIDVGTCTHCGMCDNVCPLLSDRKSASVKQALIVQDKRKDIRRYSTSGGAFTAIAEYVLEKKGFVYGAGYDPNFTVYHFGINNIADLKKLRGSKYTQSDMRKCFAEIREKLKNNVWICFSGTPCQVVALKQFLGSDNDKLVTVDMACHGVASPGLYKKYLDYWQKHEKSKLKDVEFRSKVYGYSGSTMQLLFENGKTYSNGSILQFYKNAMFAGLSLRPCCHGCKFKTKERLSDFTIFDCWDVNIFRPSMDDDLGTSGVLLHTLPSIKIFLSIKDKWHFGKIDAETLIKNDGDMITACAKINPRRAEFFSEAEKSSLPELNKKYFPMTYKKKIMLLTKPILGKIGLLNKIKRLLK